MARFSAGAGSRGNNRFRPDVAGRPLTDERLPSYRALGAGRAVARRRRPPRSRVELYWCSFLPPCARSCQARSIAPGAAKSGLGALRPAASLSNETHAPCDSPFMARTNRFDTSARVEAAMVHNVPAGVGLDGFGDLLNIHERTVLRLLGSE